jgi:hypothetical protein
MEEIIHDILFTGIGSCPLFVFCVRLRFWLPNVFGLDAVKNLEH